MIVLDDTIYLFIYSINEQITQASRIPLNALLHIKVG
jgi:hypothetical protein